MFRWKSMTSIVLFTLLVVNVLSGVVTDPIPPPNNANPTGPGSSSGGTSTKPPQLIGGDGGDQPTVTVPPLNQTMNSGCTPQIDANTGLPINADCVKTETNTIISPDAGGINGTSESTGGNTTAGSGIGTGDTGSSVAAPNCSLNPNLPGCATGPAIVPSGLTQGQIAGIAAGAILGAGALAAAVGGIVYAAKKSSAVPAGLTPRATVAAAPARRIVTPPYRVRKEFYAFEEPSLEDNRRTRSSYRRESFVEEGSSESLYRSPRSRASSFSSSHSSSSAYLKGLEAGAAVATTVHLNNIQDSRSSVRKRSKSVDSIREVSKLEERLYQEKEARTRAEFSSRFHEQTNKYFQELERTRRAYAPAQSTHQAVKDRVQIHHHQVQHPGVASASQIILVPGPRGPRGERGSSGSTGREVRYADHGYHGYHADSSYYVQGGSSKIYKSSSKGRRWKSQDSSTTDSEVQDLRKQAKKAYRAQMRQIKRYKSTREGRSKYRSQDSTHLGFSQDVSNFGPQGRQIPPPRVQLQYPSQTSFPPSHPPHLSYPPQHNDPSQRTSSTSFLPETSFSEGPYALSGTGSRLHFNQNRGVRSQSGTKAKKLAKKPIIVKRTQARRSYDREDTRGSGRDDNKDHRHE